jgi:transmembrane sensor
LASDDLIVRFLQGKATPAEVEQLREWRQRAIGNERHYRAILRIWSLTETDPRSAMATRSPTAAELLAESGRSRRWPSVRRRWFPAAPAAAAILAAALALGWSGSKIAFTPVFAATELVTGPDEMVTARLADGSVVRLAPGSRLRVAGRKGAREAWLDGQAFFAVASGPKPFLVRTRAGDALVLGTRFSFRVQEDSLQLVVVEGRVALTASGQKVEVSAGQASFAARGAAPRVERVNDLEGYLAWMDEVLVFESVPLRNVAREIERRYVVHVQLRDSVLSERTVTARFAGESLEDVLSIVCRVVDARCSMHGSVVSIEP